MNIYLYFKKPLTSTRRYIRVKQLRISTFDFPNTQKLNVKSTLKRRQWVGYVTKSANYIWSIRLATQIRKITRKKPLYMAKNSVLI